MSHVLELVGPKHDPIKERSVGAFTASFAKQLRSPDAQENSHTALSLMILLNQTPRNIYRTPETLPLVYQFYEPSLSHWQNIYKPSPYVPISTPLFASQNHIGCGSISLSCTQRTWRIINCLMACFRSSRKSWK